MISRNQGKNFAAAHWDWLVAFGGIAVLAAVAVFAFVLAGDPAEDEGSATVAAKPPDVPAADLAPLDAALESAKTPPRLIEVPDTKGSFLASGLRVFCAAGDEAVDGKGCGLPIAFGLEKCPYCGVKQKKDEAPVFDTDGDGLNDDYEKQYGLNANDPTDAHGDLDGDGFTNMEEFLAKTDPSDKNSHPDYLDSLKLVLPLNQTYSDLVFTGARKTPGGLKFDFKDPKSVNDYNRGIISVFAGEPIGKTGFTPKEYVPKFRKVKMGGGMEKSVEEHEAVLSRIRDKKEIRFKINSRKTPTDVQATLSYERGGGQEFQVTAGQDIELNGSKYSVVSIEKVGKGAKVVVKSLATGKVRSIEAIEQ